MFIFGHCNRVDKEIEIYEVLTMYNLVFAIATDIILVGYVLMNMNCLIQRC